MSRAGLFVSLYLTLACGAAAQHTVARDGDVAEARPLDLHPLATDIPEFDVDDAPQGTRTLLKRLIVDILPAKFEETKKWGGQKKVWDGVHLRMDGLNVKTKRRWKEVNHGTWKKHRVTLVDPEKYLRAKVSNIERVSLGKTSFDLLLAAKLDVHGRLQEWQRGVRLLSISADATADVEVTTHLIVEAKLDTSKIPPGLIIRPRAESAEIHLLDFELHRVSNADGPIIQELGDGLKRAVRHELADQNARMVDRINRQLSRQEEELHLSVQDLVQKKWLGFGDE